VALKHLDINLSRKSLPQQTWQTWQNMFSQTPLPPGFVVVAMVL
jgi:hypothetical protein